MVLIGLRAMKILTRLEVDSKPVSGPATDICIQRSRRILLPLACSARKSLEIRERYRLGFVTEEGTHLQLQPSKVDEDEFDLVRLRRAYHGITAAK